MYRKVEKTANGGAFVAVVTISRQFGAGGEIVARLLAADLGYRLVDRKAIVEALKSMGLSPQLIRFDEQDIRTEDMEKKRRFYLTALHDFLQDLSVKESFVLVGRGGQFLFQDHKAAFHILAQAPFSQRVEWIQDACRTSRKRAALLVRERDRRKKRYIRQVFDRAWQNMEAYDLVLNTAALTPVGAAKVAASAFRLYMDNYKSTDMAPSAENIQPSEIKEKVAFMHPSEAEFARLLDFYKIPWEYEPKTFPLRWNNEGKVTEAFSPDFYLPEQDLYLELTTQRQKLVWRKNRKARLLNDLYPDIRVKMVYNKDYHQIIESFGIKPKEKK